MSQNKAFRVLAALLIIASLNFACDINLNQSNMSATLDIADTVYCLIENVTWSVSDAITFAENNITLNCQGYTIQANLSSYYYGIYSSGYNNTVVENCTINGGFVYGIYFEDVDSGIIKNNTILNYKYEGIDAFSVTNLIIHNNTIIDYSAISFEALIVYGYGGTHPVMANVTISDNIISSLGEGIAIWSDSPPDTAYGFNIINNIVIGSDWGVIDIEALDTSIIGNNTFIYNGTDPGNWLAYIEGLTNSLVINNTFNYSNTSDTSNYAWPLYIDCWSFSEPPQNTTYYNNKIIGYNGIYIGYSAGNIFLENNITAEVWVNSTSSVPGLNYFNNSTSGNYYYTLNGTPAWQLYPIYDTNGDVWADMGALNTTIAPARWGGLNSSDFHPYTEKHMPPFALGVFYDINGVLWTVYYENNSMSMNISHEGTSVNITSDPVGGYMAVLRPDTLLSFYNYNALFINYTSGTIQTIPSTSIDSNASNSFYDPYAFAYTKQYPTLSLDSSSYYLLMLNNSSDTSLLKIFNHTTSPVISVNQTINVTTTWQTIANDNSLHTWYYPFPNNCGNDSYNISIYYDTGAASSLFATPDTTCYNKTSIANAKIAFEEKNNNMYFVQFNTYGRTYIYRLNDGMVYQINDTINSVSPFLFYDNNTFVFHATEDSGAYVYSCYFGAHPNCIKNTLANYGTPAVKVKGNGVTSTRNNTADIITYGYASSFNPVLLSFQTSTIDVKYICNNEVTFEQLPSNYRIFTSTNSVLMASGQTTWAYAIPSASLGLGTRRVYSLCTDGSNRQYFESNTSYIENAYTLNLSIGQYYSFQITDCYNLGVNDVKTTAQRYIAALSSWDTIEQAYSQVDGTATLFLEPSTPYIIILESSGRNTTSFSFSPSANITTIPVQIGCEGNVSPGIVREAVFDDLEYWIMPPGPGPLISNSSVTVNMTASSFSGRIISVNWLIIKTPTGTANVTNYSTTIVFNSSNTSRFGYNTTYTINATEPAVFNIVGTIVSVRDDIDNRNNTYNLSISVYKTTVTTMSSVEIRQLNAVIQGVIERLNLGRAFSGWAWVFVSTVMTMLVVGYVARFTRDGAGIVGAIFFTGFALLNNAVVIAPGFGSISMMMISTMSWVAVLGIIGWRHV